MEDEERPGRPVTIKTVQMSKRLGSCENRSFLGTRILNKITGKDLKNHICGEMRINFFQKPDGDRPFGRRRFGYQGNITHAGHSPRYPLDMRL